MREKSRLSPALDEVVDQILRGERIVLFPPGLGAFVGANLSFLLGAALLCAMALPMLLSAMPVHPAAAPLIGIGFAVVCLAVPAFLVAHGYRAGRPIFMGIAGSWLMMSSAVMLAILAGSLPGDARIALISVGLLGGALVTTWSVTYLSFVHFKQRLRTRRREMLNEIARKS